MSAKTITCPDCGLVLTVLLPDPQGTELVYDANEWRRRCVHPDLGGPAACLVLRGNQNPKQ
jgi:hypothetical protein